LPGRIDEKLMGASFGGRFPIEIPWILAYAKDADEFVRLSCRERAGWRRDEWAYSPLFICGKTPDFWGKICGFGPLGFQFERANAKRAAPAGGE
jgi:hypothetical protein